ncbi:MAG: hypothetical protein H6721_28695 [Sandaracinus sp.]|nr:hypothetical protein [Sandaracinus sp.]
MRTSLVFFLFASFACGGPEPVLGVPFTAEDARFFDEGVDLVGDPEALEGRWREEWATELDQRVRRADAVVYVRIRTVRTDTDLDRRTTFRLYPEAERAPLGEMPEDLVLSAREGDAGYAAIQQNEARVLGSTLILFLKWERPEGAATPTARWHLSPGTEQVTSRVEYLLERRRGVEREQRSRVIVREN